MSKLAIGALTVLLALSGCATTYQPRGFTGGFRDFKLTDDTYMVSFLANAFTSPEAVQIYLLYRCAELTVEKGFEYFVQTESVSQSQTGQNPLAGGPVITKPGHATTIRMFRERPADFGNAMNARELMRNLGPQIGQRPKSLSRQFLMRGIPRVTFAEIPVRIPIDALAKWDPHLVRRRLQVASEVEHPISVLFVAAERVREDVDGV